MTSLVQGRISAVAAIAAISLFASPAVAAGFYGQAFGGVNFQGSQKTTGVFDNVDLTESVADAEFDDGYLVGAALGYEFDWLPALALRTEFEVAYRKNDVSGLDLDGDMLSVDGDNSVFSGMANAYVEWTASPILHPYVGAGAGVARVSNDYAFALPAPGGGQVQLDDSDNRFAYQLLAGLSLDFPALPVTLFGEGRYFSAGDPSFEADVENLVGADINDVDVDSEYDSWQLTLGIRMQF